MTVTTRPRGYPRVVTTMPKPPKGESRKYFTQSDDGGSTIDNVLAMHTTPTGSHPDQWVPGTGWVDAPWTSDSHVNGGKGMTSVTESQAQKLDDVGQIPSENLDILTGGKPNICQLPDKSS